MSDGILKSLEYSIEQFVLFIHQIKSDQLCDEELQPIF